MKLLPIAFALVAAGCKQSDPPPPPPPAPPAPPHDGVELVRPGTPPLRVLRYHLDKGAKALIELVVDVDVNAGGQGGPLPTMTLDTEIACDDVLPDGTMKIKTTLLRVTASDRPGSMISAAQMTTAQLEGMAMTGVLHPDGTLEGLHLDMAGKDLPPAVSQQLSTLTRSFEQVAMPLPKEPVGLTARWRTRKTLEQNGMKMVSVTTVDLLGITGNAIEFSSDAAISGDDQTITQAGTPITIKKLGGTGHGKGTIDLAHMAMTGELAGAFHSEMSAQGQTAKMEMKLVTKLAPGKPVEPSPPDAGQGAQSAP